MSSKDSKAAIEGKPHVGGWPSWCEKRGQKVKLILDHYNLANAKTAKRGDTGDIVSSYVDNDGKIRVKLNRKHYPISISVCKLIPIDIDKTFTEFMDELEDFNRSIGIGR